MKYGYWSWRVRSDEIVIAKTDSGSFALLLNGYAVGMHPSAEAALEEAIRGSHRRVPSGLRTTDLVPSDRLKDWPFTGPAPDGQEDE